MRRIGALILAAGGSTRFGEPKQFLRFDGESLIRRIATSALDAGCQPVVIVAGETIERVRGEVSGCEVIHNAHWQRGIGSSIKCGVARLRGCVDALVILACDQPLVSAETIRALMKRDARIVASSYASALGIPALFDSRYFDALAALPDISGAKALIEANASKVAKEPFPGGAIDIDTPEDYAAALRAHAQ